MSGGRRSPESGGVGGPASGAAAVLVALTLFSAVALLATGPAPAAAGAGTGAGAATPAGVSSDAAGVTLPEADFEWSPREPEAGEAVTFDARPSTDDVGVVRYRWDFDSDGIEDLETTDPVITHTFTEPGTYEVRLTVVDNEGDTAGTTRNITVVEPSVTPTARCSVSPTATTTGETVTVDARATENATEVRFDLDGDGAVDVTREAGEEFVATVSYDDPGEYEVSVTAVRTVSTDEAGCGRVEVVENQPPTVSLSGAESATVDRAVTLTASAEDDGRIAEYRWDFDGDGTVDRVTAEGRVERAYAEPGDYEVQVTVVDGAGATATASRSVTVRPPPTAVCELSVTEVGVRDSVGLDASDSENVQRLRIDRDGDGTPERTVEGARIVTIAYDEPGEYRPRVVAVGAGNVTATAECGTVTVLGAGGPGTATTAGGGDRTDEDGGGLPLDPLWLLVLAAVALAVVLVPLLVRRAGDSGGGGDTDPTDESGETAGSGPDDGPGDGPDDDEELTFDPDAAEAADLEGVDAGPMLGGAGLPGPLRVPGAVAHAAGSVDLSAAGGEVVVDDVGFEADAIRLTAACQRAGGASAWSHGVVAADGEIEQVVVAVGDTDADRVVGASGEGTAVDLPFGEGETAGVHGSVEAVDGDGFALALTARGEEGGTETGDGPEGRGGDADDGAVAGHLWYHAVSLPEAMDVGVGRFELDQSGEYQSVPLPVDADYAVLTGVREGGTDAPVALSHGLVADDRDPMLGEERAAPPSQGAVGSAVDTVGRTAFGGGAEQAVHLPTPGDDTPTATAVRARSLARSLDLGFDDRAAIETCTVAYLAVDLDGTVPTVDVVVPGEAGATVDADGPTGLVSGVANGAVADDTERSVPGGLPRLGWSHGVAGLGAAGPGSHVLPRTEATAGETPVLVRVPAIDDEGRIVGRATVGVRFEETATRLVRLEAPDDARPAQVLYAAWPELT